MVKTPVGPAVNTPVIVKDMDHDHDQVGLSRAATGCVVNCLFKKFQISASFESLIETAPGIKESLLKLDKKVMDSEEQEQDLEFQISAAFESLIETVSGINASLLKTDKYVMDPENDTPFRGKFEVVKEPLTKLKDGAGAKNNADEFIVRNGTPKTGDTGIKQLRKNTAESKLSYEIMDDAAQAFLKTKIMDNIQTYFSVIVFAGYISEHAAAARKAIESQKYLHCQRPKVSSKKCL